jgi:heterodisulfide reductase subunit B
MLDVKTLAKDDRKCCGGAKLYIVRRKAVKHDVQNKTMVSKRTYLHMWINSCVGCDLHPFYSPSIREIKDNLVTQ